MKSKKINNLFSFSETINHTLKQCMLADKTIYCMGLGVLDPGGVFGSTVNLFKEKNLKNRFIEPPTSENGFTGVAIGMALNDLKIVISHQRVDFSLYSMDQVINSAAKWFYMFNGQKSVNITIRMVIGKGWGQGPTHSQSLHSLFAQIPGLKIVIPSGPKNVKGLLKASIDDPNPVIFLEHRWLYEMKEKVDLKKYSLPINKSKIITKGKDITIVTLSYLVFELEKIYHLLKNDFQIHIEVIDLVCASPNDYKIILNSAKKNNKILFIDIGHDRGSIMKDIFFKIFNSDIDIKKADLIAMPDSPVPTSRHIAKYFYPDSKIIIKKIFKMIGINKKFKLNQNYLNRNKDTPGDWFKGPF